jgi:hypothetical protein
MLPAMVCRSRSATAAWRTMRCVVTLPVLRALLLPGLRNTFSASPSPLSCSENNDAGQQEGHVLVYSGAGQHWACAFVEVCA